MKYHKCTKRITKPNRGRKPDSAKKQKYKPDLIIGRLQEENEISKIRY
jgi:hypothetical protein